MVCRSTSWLDQILSANARFQRVNDADSLPTARTPGRAAVVTCMDPRINLAALGIDPAGESDVRVIRTIGGMAEDRSLIVGIHLAGIREFAVVMHTDCGNCLAKAKIGTIVENITGLPEGGGAWRGSLGEPFAERLIDYLKAFDDPYVAVTREVESIRSKPFVPDDVIVYGLVYALESGALDLVVDGYAV